MSPARVRPRGIFSAGALGWANAIAPRCRAMFALATAGTKASIAQRGDVAQQIRLPGQENGVELARLPGDLRERGTIGDQGRFDAELFGDPVAVLLDPVEPGNLRLGQGRVPRIPAGAARQGL